MKSYLANQVYFSPTEVAKEIAAGTLAIPDEIDEVAARLACWMAGEAEEYVNIDDEERWPLIARMADLADFADQLYHEMGGDDA